MLNSLSKISSLRTGLSDIFKQLIRFIKHLKLINLYMRYLFKFNILLKLFTSRKRKIKLN